MAPVRLGFIGLSADGQWASKSHLPYFQSHPSTFRITALQNSTIASSKKAAKKYALGGDVAYYDNAEALASDSNVDMVVVSVKVPLHYGFIKPALEAKKDIFVEWPLAANLKEAEELTGLAKTVGSRNIVGLQARQNPSILKAKEMVESGKLGEILGTTMYGSGLVLGQTVTTVYEYMADIENGANLLTIPAGHAMDAMCYVLGEMSQLSAQLAIRRPNIDIVDSEDRVLRTAQKTSHDWMAVSGTLKNSGGVVTVVYQAGASDTGKDFYWEINGTKGILVLEAARGHVQMFHPSIKFVKAGEGSPKMTAIEVEPAKDFSYNVGKAWDAVVGEGNGSVVTFEDALVRHRMVEAIYRSHDSGRRESYL